MLSVFVGLERVSPGSTLKCTFNAPDVNNGLCPAQLKDHLVGDSDEVATMSREMLEKL